MPSVSNLSLSLVAEALVAEQLKFSFDNDGDIHFTMTRAKGKDLEFFVFDSAAKSGILVFSCMVYRWFPQNAFPKLLLQCNQWNRERRLPKAYVMDPDKDGDYFVKLEHNVFCGSGIHRDLIRDNLTIFIAGSGKFWDDLDNEI